MDEIAQLRARGRPREPTGQDLTVHLTPEGILEQFRKLSSRDPKEVVDGMRFFRRHLPADIPSSVDKAVKKRVLLSAVVDLLACHDDFDAKLEAAWCLANVVASSPLQFDVPDLACAAAVFVRFIDPEVLGSGDAQRVALLEQCMWGLGGCILHSRELMCKVLSNTSFIPHVAFILNKAAAIEGGGCSSVSTAVARSAVWTAANLFCHKTPPDEWTDVVRIVFGLAAIVKCCTDVETLSHALRGIGRVADISQAGSAYVVSILDLEQLRALVTTSTEDVAFMALNVLGVLASGSEAETQAVVNAGVVPVLFEVALRETSDTEAAPQEDAIRRAMQKDALWALSNIAAGTLAQAQDVVLHPSMQNLCAAFPRLDMACQKEVLFIISNAAGNKDEKIADAIVECGGIKALVQGLETWAPRLLKTLGDILMSPVKPAEAGFPSSRVQAVKDADGLVALERIKLGGKRFEEEEASQILEAYFDSVQPAGGALLSATGGSESLATVGLNAGSFVALSAPASSTFTAPCSRDESTMKVWYNGADLIRRHTEGFACGRIAAMGAPPHAHAPGTIYCLELARKLAAALHGEYVGGSDEGSATWLEFSAPIAEGEPQESSITTELIHRVTCRALPAKLTFTVTRLDDYISEIENGDDEEVDKDSLPALHTAASFFSEHGLLSASWLYPSILSGRAIHPIIIAALTPDGGLVGVVGFVAWT